MKNQDKNTGIFFSITLLSLWLVNGLVILLANYLFPHQIVLGTHHITVLWSMIHVPSSLALIETLVMPLFKVYENKQGVKFTSRQWLGAYLIINFISLWGLGRFAQQLGMGLASWRVALVLAVVLVLVQAGLMKRIKNWQNG